MKRTVALLVLVSLLLSCTTMTTFQSNAPDAVLTINNSNYGKMPKTVPLTNAIWQKYEIKASAPNFVAYAKPIKREAKAGPVVAGLFLFWPLLWCYGPAPTQFIQMTSVGDASVAASSASSASAPTTGYFLPASKEGKISLAVVEFQIDPKVQNAAFSGNDAALFMETYLSKNKNIELSNRINLTQILTEKELQAVDLFNSSSYKSLQGFKKSRFVLIGQIRKIGDGITVFVKIVDLETNIQSQIYERSDIMVASRGISALKDALQGIAEEIRASNSW